MQLAQKKKEKSPCKDGIKEKCLLKRLGPFKSSQILFIETIGKMPLRASQKLAGPFLSQTQGCKDLSSFERLCFKKAAGVRDITGPPKGSGFPCSVFRPPYPWSKGPGYCFNWQLTSVIHMVLGFRHAEYNSYESWGLQVIFQRKV
jgi:hypothetical protein